jgi:hypothetical protein
MVLRTSTRVDMQEFSTTVPALYSVLYSSTRTVVESITVLTLQLKRIRRPPYDICFSLLGRTKQLRILS